MIAVPSQVVVGVLVWLCLRDFIAYLWRSDCKERERTAWNEGMRFSIDAYRETYRRAWRQAQRDQRMNMDDEIRRVMRESKNEDDHSD